MALKDDPKLATLDLEPWREAYDYARSLREPPKDLDDVIRLFMACVDPMLRVTRADDEDAEFQYGVAVWYEVDHPAGQQVALAFHADTKLWDLYRYDHGSEEWDQRFKDVESLSHLLRWAAENIYEQRVQAAWDRTEDRIPDDVYGRWQAESLPSR